MSTAELPMFTYAECVKKEKPDFVPVNTPIGFVPPDDTEESKKKTASEIKEALLKDPTTLITSLLRGEVDIDDITT